MEAIQAEMGFAQEVKEEVAVAVGVEEKVEVGIEVDPFFEVGRFPLVAKLPRSEDGTFGPQVDAGYDLLVNMDTKAPVGLISPGYNLVTNQELIDVFNEASAGVPKFAITDHMNSNGSAWIRQMVFDAANMTYNIGGSNDEVRVMLEISNSYNGQSSLELRMKMWRQVCSNGLMGWGRLQTLRFKHLVSNLIDRIKDLFQLNIEHAELTARVWNEWADTPYPQIKFNDFIDMHRVSATDESSKAFPNLLSDRQATFIKDRYEPIMNEFGDEETKWGAYNVLTAISTHDIKTRKADTSHLFTAAYARMEKLTGSFYNQPENLH